MQFKNKTTNRISVASYINAILLYVDSLPIGCAYNSKQIDNKIWTHFYNDDITFFMTLSA